jgi:hypothetical protein
MIDVQAVLWLVSASGDPVNLPCPFFGSSPGRLLREPLPSSLLLNNLV